MKTIRLAAVLLLAAAASFSVLARTAVPIVNHEKIVVVPAKPTEQVRKAIVAAATSNKWTVSEAGNVITARLFVNGKHTVVVNIAYAGETYSVTYKESIDMKYEVLNGVPVIHPFYNRWVQTLVNTINSELKQV